VSVAETVPGGARARHQHHLRHAASVAQGARRGAGAPEAP
jgi:hypothetical protein